MDKFIWKVCGLLEWENLQEVALLEPDMLGFIFYPGSPRYISGNLRGEDLDSLSRKIKRVGVFVNEDLERMLSICSKFGIYDIQLHGKETPEICENLKSAGYGILKAFNINEGFDFNILDSYRPLVDYFLFDASGKYPGGNSLPFDWSLLERYTLDVPFLLSGGIGLENIDRFQEITNPALAGIDVNSRFEIRPGLKNIEKLKILKGKLKEFDLI